ncbi:aldo/keto reductase [Neisseria chenwenguii]|uniref:Aldo/keto reductase n=1 Tax=Neisseria chenwenguii TaxID=1853278 RepID=A0A220RZR4_9NEIS|nr:aldo/keto reductase [Neisseria chenwenguii]ASK26642.1 aldo/keto reductase [Neisseria chenwenguii]
MKNLPKIALGTWSWGTGFAGGDAVFGNHLSDEQMQQVFDTAMQNGLNLWDTAAVYGMGSSENALGKAIGNRRADVVLSTKFTPQIANEQAQNAAVEMILGSLNRLNTDFIDIYWIHNPHDVERWTPMLIELLQTGKVKRVGVSNHNLAQIKRANEILKTAGFAVSAVQNHYSLLYRNSEEAGILDYCREQGITFFAYMVLEQGALSGRYSPQNPLPDGSQRAQTYNKLLPELSVLTQKMAQIGETHHADTAQIAIAYAIAKGALPIIGATKPQHVTDAAAAAKIVLTDEQVGELEALAQSINVNTRGGWENDMLA